MKLKIKLSYEWEEPFNLERFPANSGLECNPQQLANALEQTLMNGPIENMNTTMSKQQLGSDWNATVEFNWVVE